jgi:hypothetical protein
MEQEGQDSGMEAESVWAQHWQPLMNDISLCMGLLGPGSPTASAATTLEAVKEVESALHELFSAYEMHGWLELMGGVTQQGAHQGQLSGDVFPVQGRAVSDRGLHLTSLSVPGIPELNQMAPGAVPHPSTATVNSPGGGVPNDRPAVPGGRRSVDAANAEV